EITRAPRRGAWTRLPRPSPRAGWVDGKLPALEMGTESAMKAWAVRAKGSPSGVFEWRDFPEPTHEAMRGFTVDLSGLRTRQVSRSAPKASGVQQTGEEPPCANYVFVRVTAAALATPDVTMATGEYPVPIERPYVSGQEAVGVVEDAAPGFEHW